MQKIALRIPKGPDFKAPTSVAIRSGNLLFVSGMAAHAREGKAVGVGDAEAQTRQALDNLKALVKPVGGTLDDVVKLTVFVRNIADRPKVNRVVGGILRRTVSAGNPGEGDGPRRGGLARGNLKQGGAV
ncbi:MAG: RidA family protein [Candidatus Methylomirabilota bacterium]